MDTSNETLGLGLVHRAVALAMAFGTTALIVSSTAVIFAGNTPAGGSQLVSAALMPFRALFGG